MQIARRNTLIYFILIAIILVMVEPCVFAECEITKYLISSGAGDGLSISYGLNQGIIGQTLTGNSSSASYNLNSGYPIQNPPPVQGSREIAVTGTIDDNSATVTVNSVPAIVAHNIYTATITISEGENLITAVATDPAGNTAHASVTVYLDTIPPSMPTLAAVITPTGSPTQVLSGTKQANTSVWLNGQQIIHLNAQTTWSYTMTLAQGNNPIALLCKDAAGNSSSVVNSNILCDLTSPTTPLVQDDGQYTLSTTQLHAVWSASDPETGIAEYQYGIGTTPNSPNVVGWTSAGIQTEVTHTGLSLTSGQTYYFLVKAQNGVGLWSEVGTSDGITVNTAPTITQLSPPQYASFTEGSAVAVSVTATDPDGDTLEYQISIDNNIVQPWSTQTTYSWQTQAGNNGYHIIKAEVRDNKLGFDEQENQIYIFRQPVGTPQ